MGVFTSAELVATVSNAGGLGSLGTGLRPVESLHWRNISTGKYMKPNGPRPAESLGEELPRIRQLTDRPFVVNYTLSQANQEKDNIIRK